MPPLYKFHHHAMATVFEVVICQEDVDEAYAGQAARAVFEEVDRLETDLSRFRSGSDLWRISGLKAGESTPIGLAATDCLALAQAVQAETEGAFDITVGPLMKIFRQEDGRLRTPSEEEVAYARERIGPNKYELEDSGFIKVHVDNLVLDLGGIGKGYALDQAVDVLKDWSVYNALLNAGDSTVLGVGAPGDEPGWIVTAGNRERLSICLRDLALSGSGFQEQGSHIMDPRTLRPLPVKAERVWAIAPTAAMSDALSTAFTVMNRAQVEAFCSRYPEVQSIMD